MSLSIYPTDSVLVIQVLGTCTQLTFFKLSKIYNPFLSVGPICMPKPEHDMGLLMAIKDRGMNYLHF